MLTQRCTPLCQHALCQHGYIEALLSKFAQLFRLYAEKQLGKIDSMFPAYLACANARKNIANVTCIQLLKSMPKSQEDYE